MSLPDGVTTCLLTYGPITDTFGNLADSITVEVVADRTIVHGPSGRTLFKNPVLVTAGGGGVAQLPTPHTDQSGFRDQQQNSLTGWYYTVRLTARFGNDIQVDIKTFQPVVGQTTVDADLLPSNGMVTPGVTAPTATVTSVGGHTGAVSGDDILGAIEPALLATYASLDEDGVLVIDGEPVEVGGGSSLRGPGGPTYNIRPDNFRKWRAAGSRVRAGIGNAKVAFDGDSTMAGQGSTVRSVNTAPAQFARLMDSYYLPTKHSFIANTPSGNIHDDRVSGTGWVFSNNAAYAPGGVMTIINPTTGTLSFTPAQPVDTFDIYWTRPLGAGTFTVNIDGGSTLATVDTSTAANGKTTVTAALGTHVLNLVGAPAVNNQVWVKFVDGYNSSAKSVHVLNGGVGATVAASMLGGADYDAPKVLEFLAPDLTVLSFTVNDINNGTPVGTWEATMGSTITYLKAFSDVLLVTGIPSAGVSDATQKVYVDGLYRLADTYDVGLVEIAERWSSYAVSNPLGYYSDSLHGTDLGYADVATAIFNALKTI